MEAAMRSILALLAITVLPALGCDRTDKEVKDMTPKTNDLGTGLNTVDRTYARPAGALIDIVAEAIRSYDLKIDSNRHDELGGEVVALRADGHKVTAKITSVDKEHSQVSIRVAPGNRNLAEMLHERIAEKLGAAGVK
jgi:hypothetical protein